MEKDNQAIKVISEKIRNSIENDSLNKDLDVIRLQAADMGLNMQEVDEIVKAEQQEHNNLVAQVKRSMQMHKAAVNWIYIASVIIAILLCYCLHLGILAFIIILLLMLVLATLLMGLLIYKNLWPFK